MKNILSRIFAFIFKVLSLLSSIKDNKITFIMTHDDKFNGNIKYVYEYIKNNYPKYELNIISRNDYDADIRKKNFFKIFKQIVNLYIIKNYNLATSKYIFLNNIFITAAYMSFKDEVRIIQLWHAIGTFKKFGENYKPSDKIDRLQKKANSIYTDVVVCSDKDVDVYSKAFNINKDKVHVVGSPACDVFNDKIRIENIKQKVYTEYPSIKNKRTYLYAPTFRDSYEENMKILNYVNKISKELKNDEDIVLLRLHPHIYKKYADKYEFNNVIDVSNYEDVIELMVVSDVLITDYSSLFYEYSYLEKPIIFFAFDLEKYNITRGFYYDYYKYVPGEVVDNIDKLIKKINIGEYNCEKISEFKTNYFDYIDGNSTKRLLDFLKL